MGGPQMDNPQERHSAVVMDLRLSWHEARPADYLRTHQRHTSRARPAGGYPRLWGEA